MADGEIILGVDVDARQAEEKIQRLTNELAKLKINNSNLSPKLREIAQEAGLCEQHILRLKNALRNANDSTVISKLNREIQANEQYLKTLTNEYSKVLSKQQEIKSSIASINKEIGNIRKEKIDALSESHRKAEQAAKMHSQSESKLVNVLSSIPNPISKISGLISGLTSRIFYLASSAFVFNVISAGFRALSKELRNLIAQDAELVMWLNNVKANLMTAFYPIYQAALPALRALGQMLSWITAQLAQFIAMLTGTSVSANQQGAKQMYMRSALSNSGNTRAYNAHTKSQARANKVKSSNAAKVAKSTIKTAGTQKDDIGKSVSQAYNSAGKSAEDNAKKLAKFDKAATKSRKELAKFDKIDVLKQDKEKSLKEIIPKTPKVSMPKEPKLAEVPDVTPFIPNMPVLEGFKQNLESIQLSPFFENILKWFERLKEPLKNISFENLNRELGNLWEALLKLGVGQVGERLLWFYDNVLVPLAQWTIEDLLPNFLKVLTSCLEAIEPIVKEANEQLGMLWDVFLKPAAEWVGDKITEFLGNLADWIKNIGDSIKDNQPLIELLAAFLVGLSSATLIVALAQLAAGIWGVVTATIAWGAAMLANPMTWVILGIAALIAIIILCIKHWDDIKAALGDFWERAKKIWEKLGKKFEEIKKKLGNLSGDLGELFENTIKLLSKIWNFLKPFIKWILDVAIDFLLTNFENMSVTLANIIGDITDAIDGITKFLSGLIDFITGVFTGDWDKAWSGLGKMFDGFVQTIKASINILIDFINSMINAITGGINVAIRGINKIGFDLPDWLGGHHFGLNIPEIPENALNIPKLAQGSVLKGGDPFLAWVNDQPRGQTNVEAPLDTIVRAFKEAAGNNGNQNIVIEANGDLGGIIRELNFRLKNENRRIGTEIMVPSGVL